jgi:hypothetical protein
MRVKEKHNQKLLLEGNDDQHVIWALCEKYSITESFDVIDCEGITKLIDQIPIRFKQSNIETVGIIIDADANLKNRWTSLKSTLELLGFVLPIEIPIEGLISKNNDVTIGVWIMPNNNLNGMLEDFISFLVPKNDKLLPIITSTLNDIEAKKLNSYPLIHKSKAIIHTWLSWQEDPGTPMGLSITKRYLNTNVQTCDKLMNWLNNLFNAK